MMATTDNRRRSRLGDQVVQPPSGDRWEALEKLAREATAGPWVYEEPGEHSPRSIWTGDWRRDGQCIVPDVFGGDGRRLSPEASANAAFIAASDPPTVLELIGRVRELDHECIVSMETIAAERARAETAEAKLAEAEGQINSAEARAFLLEGALRPFVTEGALFASEFDQPDDELVVEVRRDDMERARAAILKEPGT